jgi:hypothetical protein
MTGGAAFTGIGEDIPPPPEPDWSPIHGNGHRPAIQATGDEPDLYVNVAALLDGELPEPPKPALLTRTDGHALLYAGRVNSLFGDPEAGKTWVALAACVEALNAGRRVLILDLDHNGAEAVVPNLLALGAHRNILVDRATFRYCEPHEAAEVYSVVTDCQTWRPAVALIDSIGELLPMLGASSNSADEYTIANGRVLQPLADAGAAVIGIDHLAQNLPSRTIGPTGTTAKRRAIGGTAFRVKTCRQFIPGKGGAAWLLINKDRHGGVRKHCPTDGNEREPLAGTFVLDPPSSGHGMSWRVTAPTLGHPGASLADKTAQYLEVVRGLGPGWTTAVRVAATVSGDDPPTQAQREQARYHLGRLTDDGLLEHQPGGPKTPAKWRAAEFSSGISSETLFGTPAQDSVQDSSEL